MLSLDGGRCTRECTRQSHPKASSAPIHRLQMSARTSQPEGDSQSHLKPHEELDTLSVSRSCSPPSPGGIEVKGPCTRMHRAQHVCLVWSFLVLVCVGTCFGVSSCCKSWSFRRRLVLEYVFIGRRLCSGARTASDGD